MLALIKLIRKHEKTKKLNSSGAVHFVGGNDISSTSCRWRWRRRRSGRGRQCRGQLEWQYQWQYEWKRKWECEWQWQLL